MTTDTLAGGCQCGAVRYTVKAETVTVYACHCLECQKQSASACALSIPLSLDVFDIAGPLKSYERPTDSGTTTSCWFCENCGTRVYHQSARSSRSITLKGGTLDDTGSLNPVAHLWTRRKQSWVILPPAVPAFETQPADLTAWRKTLVSPESDP